MTLKFTRRTFLHGASVGVLSSMLPTAVEAVTPEAGQCARHANFRCCAVTAIGT